MTYRVSYDDYWGYYVEDFETLAQVKKFIEYKTCAETGDVSLDDIEIIEIGQFIDVQSFMRE